MATDIQEQEQEDAEKDLTLQGLLEEGVIDLDEWRPYENQRDFLVAVGEWLSNINTDMDEVSISLNVLAGTSTYWTLKGDYHVKFRVHGKDALVNLHRALGGDGTKCLDRFDDQCLAGMTSGFIWTIGRTDLTCEYVETGETEEVEEYEEISPARTRVVVKEQPVKKKVCPPLLSD